MRRTGQQNPGAESHIVCLSRFHLRRVLWTYRTERGIMEWFDPVRWFGCLFSYRYAIGILLTYLPPVSRFGAYLTCYRGYASDLLGSLMGPNGYASGFSGSSMGPNGPGGGFCEIVNRVTDGVGDISLFTFLLHRILENGRQVSVFVISGRLHRIYISASIETYSNSTSGCGCHE